MTCTIRSTGHAVGSRCVSSAQIEQELGLAPGWIAQRTGIETRSIAAAEEATSDLAVRAGESALSESSDGSIGMLILATSTPDHLLPPTAPAVAHRLGLGNIPAFDMAVACTGFVYGLEVGRAIVDQTRSGVLVIGANVLSRRVDPTDAATRALFADAAGAFLLAFEPNANRQIIGTHLEADGENWHMLKIPAGGSRLPIDESSLDAGQQFIQISEKQRLFRFAVDHIAGCSQTLLARHGYGVEDLDWWVPHQANHRIMTAAQRQLGVPDEKVVSTIRELGNSSAATIPTACSIWNQRGKFESGQLILLSAAGAGLASGAALIRW